VDWQACLVEFFIFCNFLAYLAFIRYLVKIMPETSRNMPEKMNKGFKPRLAEISAANKAEMP
jgi:hypothetical protein